MHSIFAAYEIRQRRRDAGPSALRNATVWLGKADAWMTEHEIDPLLATEDELEDYKEFLRGQYAPTTVKLAITQVRAAYRNAHRKGIISSDPGADLLAPPLPEVEPVTFTPEQLRAILATVPTRRHDAMIRLMMFGGMRRCEVCRMRWDDLDFANRTMTVIGKGSNGGKIRKTPIHPALAESLHALWPSPVGYLPMTIGRPSEWVLGTKKSPQLTVDAFQRMILTVSTAAGVEIQSHSFRKTLTSDLFERGVQAEVLDRMFGWSPSSVRGRHYTRVASEPMQQAILLAYKTDNILPKLSRAAA